VVLELFSDADHAHAGSDADDEELDALVDGELLALVDGELAEPVPVHAELVDDALVVALWLPVSRAVAPPQWERASAKATTIGFPHIAYAMPRSRALCKGMPRDSP
jgi:hypothetical protein